MRQHYKWAITTVCKGDSDILELFINWYYDKATLLTIGLHNPTKRILKLIEDVKIEKKLDNLNVFIFNSEFIKQPEWVNYMYKEIVKNQTDFDIYAHVDIDEFIYRFDLIEENFKKNRVLKFDWVNIIRDSEDKELRWSVRPTHEIIPDEQISEWTKALYCIGDNYESLEYHGGQHNIVFHGIGESEYDVKTLNYPIHYHLPYRNEVQAYSKISNLINNFTAMKFHISNTWGTHVLKHFLDLHSPNYAEIFDSVDLEDFNIEIDQFSLYNFANIYVEQNKNDLYPIDSNFIDNYFNKFYNEKNSLLDFVEEDLSTKMNTFRKEFNAASLPDNGTDANNKPLSKWNNFFKFKK